VFRRDPVKPKFGSSNNSTISQGSFAPGADPLIFLLIPLETIPHRLIASKQTEEDIDERPPVTTSTTPSPAATTPPTTTIA